VKHTINVVADDRYGEISRVLAVFQSQGCRIETLTMAPAAEAGLVEITIVVEGAEPTVAQVVKRLQRQVRVVQAVRLSSQKHLARAVALVRVSAQIGPQLAEALRLVAENRLRLLEVTPEGLSVEATGEWKELGVILEKIGIAEPGSSSRSGLAVLAESAGEPLRENESGS
jgi:acetolactate synthase-1/3 small subunit